MQLPELAEALQRLPADGTHPLGLPPSLAERLAPRQRLPRQVDLRHLPAPWVAYRLLALHALSGWSLRWALFVAEAAIRGVQPTGGTYKRCARALIDAGLWQTAVVKSVGTYALVRLTEEGVNLLNDLGLTPVEGEWERLDRLHRGDTAVQLKHTAAVCLFAFHARQRGYETLVAPSVDDPTAEPDLRLCREDEVCYVEVQRRGGEPWKRAAKWWNLMRLQGYVALCAMTPAGADALVAELTRCGIRRYRVTDLETLHRHNPQALWQQR
jgi:hypothetical protein